MNNRQPSARRSAPAAAVTLWTALVVPTAALAAPTIETCAPDSGNRAIAEHFDARWSAAMSSRDTRALEGLYAESAVLMPPSDETFVGRAPVTAFLSGAATPARSADYSVDLVACELRGELLHVAGVWGTGAGASRVTGNVLRVLEPAGNGQWVSRYEIWN